MFSPIRGNASSFPSLMIVNEQYPSLASHSELIDKIEKAQELPLDSSHWQESGLVPPHQNLDSLCMNSLSEKQTDRLAKEDAFPGESAIGDILTGHTVWVVPNWKDDQTWLALQITHTLKALGATVLDSYLDLISLPSSPTLAKYIITFSPAPHTPDPIHPDVHYFSPDRWFSMLGLSVSQYQFALSSGIQARGPLPIALDQLVGGDTSRFARTESHPRKGGVRKLPRPAALEVQETDLFDPVPDLIDDTSDSESEDSTELSSFPPEESCLEVVKLRPSKVNKDRNTGIRDKTCLDDDPPKEKMAIRKRFKKAAEQTEDVRPTFWRSRSLFDYGDD